MKISFRWKRKCLAGLRNWIVLQWWSRKSVVCVVIFLFLLNHRSLCTAQLPNGIQLLNASELITPTPSPRFMLSTSASALCTMHPNGLTSKPLRTSSLPTLCDCLNRVDVKEARCILENYRLQFCSHIPLSLTEICFDNSTFCRLRLESIIQADERARLDFLRFQEIVNRQDCDPMTAPEDKFSVLWKCPDCLNAYRNWICATYVLPEVSKNVSSCAATCIQVLQRCPYFVPDVEHQYSGMPVFDCNDKVLEDFQQEDEGNDSCFDFEDSKNALSNCTEYKIITQPSATPPPSSSLQITPFATVNTGAASVWVEHPKTNLSSWAIHVNSSDTATPQMKTEKDRNTGS